MAISVLCPLPEAEICQNPGSGRSDPRSLGKDAQLSSLERASLPGLAETGACGSSGYSLSLSSGRVDAVKRLDYHD